MFPQPSTTFISRWVNNNILNKGTFKCSISHCLLDSLEGIKALCFPHSTNGACCAILEQCFTVLFFGGGEVNCGTHYCNT